MMEAPSRIKMSPGLDQVVALYKLGLSGAIIAERLGCGPTHVYRLLRENGYGPLVLPTKNSRNLPRGVYRRKNPDKPFVAKYNSVHLGVFDTAEQAHAAYLARAKRLADERAAAKAEAPKQAPISLPYPSSLTAHLCGDPLPGRSAYYQKTGRDHP